MSTRQNKLLAIDIGNTKIHFGLFSNNKLLKKKELLTHAGVASIKKLILALSGKEKFDVIVASVVPAVLDSVRKIVVKDFGIKPVVVSSKLPLKIELRYKRPEKLGADRIANVVGGYHLYGGPLIVVDFGTAITFDVVDKKGNFGGGAIAPGLSTMFSALKTKTAQLPAVRAGEISNRIGRDTKSAIEFGVVEGANGAVKEIISILKKSCRIKGNMKLIATGGDSTHFAKRIKIFNRVHPDLTLIGMKEIFKRVSAARTIK